MRVWLPSIAGVVFVVWLLFAPFDTVPGVIIGGTDTPVPTNWSTVNDHEEALLEADTGIPYVVTIWYSGTKDGLFVSAIATSEWLARVRAAPNVRIRIGDATYKVRARELSDPERIAIAAGPYDEKYRVQMEAWDGADDFDYVWVELVGR